MTCIRRDWIICLLALCAGWAGDASAVRASQLQQREEAAIRAAVARVAPSVVSIETVGGLDRVGEVLIGSGPTTGLIVSPDGYIISSAFNFAQKPSSILVGLPDGTRTPAQLVATDRNRMLALLKINVDDPLAAPEMAPPGEVAVGQWAIAVGRTFSAQEPNISIGIISALRRVWDKAVQTDAKISPSNYGGPLIDIRGRIIGVLVPLSPEQSGESAGVEWYDSGIGFAIPMDQVTAIVPRLRAGQDLLRGIMGVNLKAGDMYGEEVKVVSSRPNSPAAKAGLAKDDVITAIDGLPITQRIDLTREIQRRYAGDRIRVQFRRGEETLERELELIGNLDPYARPFVGILPERGSATVNEAVVRFVYEKSPADKAGMKIGDRITGFNGAKFKDAAELAALVAQQAPGYEVALDVIRGEETREVKLKLGEEPSDVPQKLPAIEQPEGDPQRPTVGRHEWQAAGFENKCLAYVPTNYDVRRRYGLLVWLHGRGGYDDDALVERWGPICDREGLILLAPKASDKQRWSPQEVEVIEKLIAQARDEYQVDPRRVAIQGNDVGGPLACVVAFNQRDSIRGLSVVQSAIPARPPENDPATPLTFYLAGAKDFKLPEATERLRKLKFSVVARDMNAKAKYLTDEELAEFLRWFDALDRI